MEQVAAATSEQQTSKVKRLQLLTIGWMLIELCVSLFAGIQAHSVALTSFGADSGIELMSAVVVLRRFALGPKAERRAARTSGILLYLLAAYIIAASALSIFRPAFHPKPSRVGLVLLVAAAIIMPLLGRAKKRLARKTGSHALRADAVQSNVCAYMSWIALMGLLANFLFHLAWADSVGALLLLPIVLKEAREASKGDACEC